MAKAVSQKAVDFSHPWIIELSMPSISSIHSGFGKCLRSLVMAGLFCFGSPVAAQEQSLAGQIAERSYTDDLPEIRKRKRIRALVTYSWTDFFFDDSGAPKGLQVEVLQAYEKHLNKGVKKAADRVRVQFIPTTFERLIPDDTALSGAPVDEQGVETESNSDNLQIRQIKR